MMTSRLPLLSVPEMEAVLRSARTIAVLGIKPESRREMAAYFIPEAMAAFGYEIIPVPVRYPEVHEILGQPVVRDLADVPRPVDILNVFLRPETVMPHVPAIIDLRPGVVWSQSGCLDPDAAQQLVAVGLRMAHDCIGCRRAAMLEAEGRPAAHLGPGGDVPC